MAYQNPPLTREGGNGKCRKKLFERLVKFESEWSADPRDSLWARAAKFVIDAEWSDVLEKGDVILIIAVAKLLGINTETARRAFQMLTTEDFLHNLTYGFVVPNEIPNKLPAELTRIFPKKKVIYRSVIERLAEYKKNWHQNPDDSVTDAIHEFIVNAEDNGILKVVNAFPLHPLLPCSV
jgi:hypothetical protein